jgi:hypothetical protein
VVGVLRADGQHLGDQVGVLGVAKRGVGEQGVDRGQPRVSGADGVASHVFEVGQEIGYEVRCDIGNVEVTGCDTGALPGVVQQ